MSLQSDQFLDNELSTESDRESTEMRIARILRKFEDLKLEDIKKICFKYWTAEEISAAFKLYIEEKV